MIAFLRRLAEARTARHLESVSFCEGCAQPVCTAACRAEAALTRAHERGAIAAFHP
jgi:Fe-S-cluster-containing dehydrogenase component